MSLRTRLFPIVMLSILGAAPAAADLLDTPDFNDERRALESVRALEREVAVRAGTRPEQAYARQCTLSVNAVEDQAAIYGAPPKADLVRAWNTCREVLSRIDPAIPMVPPARADLGSRNESGHTVDITPGLMPLTNRTTMPVDSTVRTQFR